MAMFWGTRPAVHVEPPRAVAARTVRKIALFGSHPSSLEDAPWTDPSWECWGHACSRSYYQRRMDRFFDLHPPACWSRAGKKGQPDTYATWLKRNTTPIYMQKKYPEVPASIEYPKERILTEFGDTRPYFTNQTAWMIALALTEGVSTIGLWGINYSSESEYVRQRGSAEYWLGRAAERGVRIVLPRQTTLLAEPALLYGYESHDEKTAELKDDYKRKEWKPAETIRPIKPGDKLVEPPSHIKKLIEEEEREQPRPAWALRPLPEETTPHLKAVG